jgi:hypothetical protein
MHPIRSLLLSVCSLPLDDSLPPLAVAFCILKRLLQGPRQDNKRACYGRSKVKPFLGNPPIFNMVPANHDLLMTQMTAGWSFPLFRAIIYTGEIS